MVTLLSGIKWGLILTILVGPIMFSLVQAGIEKGLKLGVTLGAGVWLSDILYVCIVYWGMNQVNISNEFYFNIGVVGGAVLVIFGVASLLTKPKPQTENLIEAKTYGGYFIKGFLINAFNPFTIFFWVTVSTTEARDFLPQQAFIFFFGIIGTIMITDVLKVLLAKQVRKFMTPRAINRTRIVSGIAMILFGVLLFARIMTNPPQVM